MTRRLPFRLRASLVHLGCSAAIASIAMVVVFHVWHPADIASLQGVGRLITVLIAIDVVLGPIMTLILFSTGKARHLLEMDLAIVASLQLAALVYGLVTVFNARPVYVVFNVDRFTIVTAAEIVDESLGRASRPDFQRLPMGRPRVIAARLPDDPLVRTELMFSSLDGGTDIFQFPELYVDYHQERERAIARSRPLAELKARNNLGEAEWRAFLSCLNRLPADLAYLPVGANSREGVAVIDRRTGDVVDLVDLYPEWG